MTSGAFALQWAAERPEPRSVRMLIDAGMNQPQILTSAYYNCVSQDPDTNPMDRLKCVWTVQMLLNAGGGFEWAAAAGAAGRGGVQRACRGHRVAQIARRTLKMSSPATTQPAKLGYTAMLDQPWRAWLLNAIGYKLDINSAAAYGFDDRVAEILREHPEAVDGGDFVRHAADVRVARRARGDRQAVDRRRPNVNPQVERGGWIGCTPLEAAVARGTWRSCGS